MDTEKWIEIAPHYVAMILLAFLAVGILRASVHDPSFWIELGIVVLVIFGYRPAVVRLGVEPSPWEQ